MAKGGFITYYRVSTDRQGRSGLGLDAQRDAVRAYLNGGDWTIEEEFCEVESGKAADRPELAKALAACRLRRVPLVVAKVDRLTRSVAFLTRLLEAGVDVRFCDLPQIEGPTGKFLLQQLAAVAELEAGLISQRTKDALKAARARGQKLGGRRGGVMPDAVRVAGRAAKAAKSADRAADIAPIVRALQRGGVTTLRGIAAGLEDRGIETARGSATWTATAVRRLLEQINGL